MKKIRSIIRRIPQLHMYKYLISMVLLMTVVFSCKKADKSYQPQWESGDQAFTVVEHTELDRQDLMDMITLTPDHPDIYDYHDLYYDLLQEAPGDWFYSIAHDVVKYKSTDDQGNEIELSGLFIYPFRLIGDRVKTPLISVNHGTELLKKYAPSKWKKDWNPLDWGNFAEVIIADLMAFRYGWAIVMPDYQGMGSDLGENHPYCIREKLAVATADMVENGINTIKDNKHKYITWNGKLFLLGYSEGGFVTMSATRELERRDVPMNGSVCMDGPYDLSGTMLEVMLSDNAFPVPYFLPLMLVGYNTIYPDVFRYDVMLKEPYRTTIPKYTTGFYSADVVNGIMPQSKILKEVFTDQFMDSLTTNSSQAFQTLVDNDSYLHWTPKTKMLLWHCKNDDCVPFGNFITAKNQFIKLGVTDIDYVEWPPVINWEGTVHVSVAPRAFLEGAHWIHNQLN
ncbi:MAG: hypothetical protein HQ542_12650 [Bacteroidia bacterium]|nr:hypothetical protein [Bacteroidia bacterium]